ncbi:DUF4357 domain-containing protein [Halodesulfovibrio sp.]|jgi:transcriptional regulator with XRE-family HTH domain|uniref:DUF4357 domain-containing protein n=1 Tax=Halodesulfovibrio sp. TaxID=1912772 RepID=UPI0025E0A7ED|nr:DUF4357 domain-containing protein [Halodesulfovibrio sp.]MCT4627727.1 DUF4357 domain-containing protein [Halodesulfovibrio sp.]
MKKKTLSFRIREAITALNVSDAEFAKAGGISGPALSMYINQGRQPKAMCIANWSTYYNIDTNWLLTGKGNIFKQEDISFSNIDKNIYTNPMILQLNAALNALDAAEADDKTIQSTIVAIVGQNLQHKAPCFIPITTRKNNATARFYTKKSIILCAGSIVEGTKDSMSNEALRQRKEAELKGNLRKTDNGKLITTKDLPFKSISSTAGFVVGSSKNGWDYWIVTQTGQPLSEFKDLLKSKS